MGHRIYDSDNMVAVGERPWHGKGVLLDQALTPMEMLEKANLLWTVSAKPLQTEDGIWSDVRLFRDASDANKENVKQGKPEKDKAHRMLVRDDTGERLGVVSPQYHIFQNVKIAELFDPLVKDGFMTIETCGSLENGRKVWMLARTKDEDQPVRKDDLVRNYLLFAHGHGGNLAARFGMTPTRVVCWNTLSLAIGRTKLSNGQVISDSKLVRLLHTKNMMENLTKLRDAFDKVSETFMLTTEQYRWLATRGVSKADLDKYAQIVVGAPEDTKEQTVHQKKKMDRIIKLASEGRGNSGSTWWDAYNGYTEYLTWERGKSADSRMNSIWLGDGARDNRHAYEVAMQLAT